MSGTHHLLLCDDDNDDDDDDSTAGATTNAKRKAAKSISRTVEEHSDPDVSYISLPASCTIS